MKRKSTQTLLLVFSSLLLLISVTVSAQGQPTPRPTPGPGQDRLRGNSPGFFGEWDTVTSTGGRSIVTLRYSRSDDVVTGGFEVTLFPKSSSKPLDGSVNDFVKVSAFTAEPVLQTSGGSIRGTVKDNVLRFTWRQELGGQGAGRFTLSSDGESFEGTFSATSNPDDTSGGTWNGKRRYSFAGAWQGKFGDGALQLILQQDGLTHRVAGQINVNSADLGLVSDGIVNGNTLRFNILRADPRKVLPSKPEFVVVGTGELVMERGGKSFTGTILGAATSGTLVGR